ncbi:MAG TPA: helical backbone metal receptor [Chitinophagaceae bacterium]|nr:helical backbone metal receptor [Chitinophagaceae bacterium]
MPLLTDQTGSTLPFTHAARRIISLVPSQTELLYELGLDQAVAGITKFCIHPHEWFRTKVRIGGTKQVHMDRIEALAPDLIIANKEENERDQVEALRKKYPVYTSDVHTLPGAYGMIADIGQLTGRQAEAAALVKKIQDRFDTLPVPQRRRRAAYLIWNNPLMTVGGDTFIHHLLEKAGFENIYKHKTRYPVVTIEEIAASGIECLLLSSEPYPFKENHKEYFEQALPTAQVRIVDGELFSWYGSRLLLSPAYFMVLRKELGIA